MKDTLTSTTSAGTILTATKRFTGPMRCVGFMTDADLQNCGILAPSAATVRAPILHSDPAGIG
jgi:hypothetical protein